MKTAEEFRNYFLSTKTFEEIATKYYGNEIMVEFAEMHVEEALKQAIEKCEINYVIHGHDLNWTVKKHSILDSYPLENIK